MSIRRQSDLPMLLSSEINSNGKQGDKEFSTNFLKSGFEISYYDNSTYGDTTYKSKFMTLTQLSGALLDSIFDRDWIFYDGIQVSNYIKLSGDLILNEHKPDNEYESRQYFKSYELSVKTYDITANNCNLHVSDKISVDGNLLIPTASSQSDGKTAINKDYVDNYIESRLSSRIKELETRISTLEDTSPLYYENVFPVGSIYISYLNTVSCPVAKLGTTWQKIEGYYLLASGNLDGETHSSSSSVTEPQYVTAGAPQVGFRFTITGSGKDDGGNFFTFGCKSKSCKTITGTSSGGVYGQSSTIRPKAVVVDVWRRIS